MMNCNLIKAVRIAAIIFILSIITLSLFGCSDSNTISSDTASAIEESVTVDIKNTPWVTQNRQPRDYTWDEFEKLNDTQKELFYESFSSNDDFDLWMSEAKKNANSPWIKEGKIPQDYTWSEFEALTDTQKELFYESFGSNEEFDKWMKQAQENN